MVTRKGKWDSSKETVTEKEIRMNLAQSIVFEAQNVRVGERGTGRVEEEGLAKVERRAESRTPEVLGENFWVRKELVEDVLVGVGEVEGVGNPTDNAVHGARDVNRNLRKRKLIGIGSGIKINKE